MDTTTTATRCHRCGRALRSESSVSRGYGRTCAAKIAKATKVVDLSAYKAFQVEKAAEVIELGGLVRVGRGQFLAVSSDGSTNYEVDAAARSCSCKAGQHGRTCYHVAAGLILTAA